MLALIAHVSASCGEDAPLAAGAVIEVSPNAIDFGAVAAGQTRVVELRIRNRSPTRALEIARLTLSEGTSPELSLGPVPSVVDPGAEASVAVRYAPIDGEPDAGRIVIESNADNARALPVPLSSSRTLPGLEVRPERIDFGAIETGRRSETSIRLLNRGLAPLVISRLSLRTEGFAGEACSIDADCREGRCTDSRTGSICATPCTGGCREGYVCSSGIDGLEACREGPAASPPRAIRGFSLTGAPDPSRALASGESIELAAVYEPGAADRGPSRLVIESNDPARPFFLLPLIGRPENLPPVAVAALEEPRPPSIGPGTRVALTGAASSDPEGGVLSYEWRFILRPEGSRAAFDAPSARDTGFTVDLPGSYVAALEVRDDTGLASTNDARVEVTASAGSRLRVELSWDRGDSDLDLHLIAPGGRIGSMLDAYQDNPSPDWGPAGAAGDPAVTAAAASESIAVQDPADGVYTVLVRVAAPSPQGATRAQIAIFFDAVEAIRLDAILSPSAEQWDVATLSRPSGRLVELGTIR